MQVTMSHEPPLLLFSTTIRRIEIISFFFFFLKKGQNSHGNELIFCHFLEYVEYYFNHFFKKLPSENGIA